MSQRPFLFPCPGSLPSLSFSLSFFWTELPPSSLSSPLPVPPLCPSVSESGSRSLLTPSGSPVTEQAPPSTRPPKLEGPSSRQRSQSYFLPQPHHSEFLKGAYRQPVGPEGGAGSSRERLAPRDPWGTHAAPLPGHRPVRHRHPLVRAGSGLRALGVRSWQRDCRSLFIVILGTMTISSAAPGAQRNPLTRLALALHSRAAASQGKGCQASV